MLFSRRWSCSIGSQFRSLPISFLGALNGQAIRSFAIVAPKMSFLDEMKLLKAMIIPSSDVDEKDAVLISQGLVDSVKTGNSLETVNYLKKLSVFCSGENYRGERCASLGTHDSLLGILSDSSKSRAEKIEACKTIQMLCLPPFSCSMNMRHRLGLKGGCDVLVSLIISVCKRNDVQDIELLREICSALRNLTFDNLSNSQALAQLGISDIFIKTILARYCDDPIISEHACAVISNVLKSVLELSKLSESVKISTKLGASGACDIITKSLAYMLASNASDAVVCENLRSLWYLTFRCTNNIIKLSYTNFPSLLATILQKKQDNMDICEFGLGCANNLAFFSIDNRRLLVHLGIIPSTISILKRYIPPTKAVEFNTRDRGIRFSEVRRSNIMDADGVITSTIEDDPVWISNRPVCRQSVTLIRNLGQDDGNSELLVEAIPPMIAIVGKYMTNEDMIEQACAAIKNLSYNNKHNSAVLMSLGTSPLLATAVRMYKTKNEPLCQQACFAIRNLTHGSMANSKKFESLGIRKQLLIMRKKARKYHMKAASKQATASIKKSIGRMRYKLPTTSR